MKDLNINPDLLIKDVRPYVLWRRVSTKEQGNSELGLQAQLTIALNFTKREPEAIFTDVHSGTKLSGCQQLWQAIELCKSNNYLLVIAKTDRFRNVREALEVLDVVGEYNLSFCDLPVVNRMILTIMFSMWESQALMGRINTKLALDERIKQRDLNGGWTSKSGNWCTHLGSKKGVNMDKARNASIESKRDSILNDETRLRQHRMIIELRKRGMTVQEVASAMNDIGEKTPNGFAWSSGTVSRDLKWWGNNAK